MASSGNPAPRASWKALHFGIKNKSDFKTILGPYADPGGTQGGGVGGVAVGRKSLSWRI